MSCGLFSCLEGNRDSVVNGGGLASYFTRNLHRRNGLNDAASLFLKQGSASLDALNFYQTSFVDDKRNFNTTFFVILISLRWLGELGCDMSGELVVKALVPVGSLLGFTTRPGGRNLFHGHRITTDAAPFLRQKQGWCPQQTQEYGKPSHYLPVLNVIGTVYLMARGFPAIIPGLAILGMDIILRLASS